MYYIIMASNCQLNTIIKGENAVTNCYKNFNKISFYKTLSLLINFQHLFIVNIVIL